jgi:ABC-type dipeptide/oligopeptide/nickel transport system permease subunit
LIVGIFRNRKYSGEGSLTQLAMRRLLKDKFAMGSIAIVLFAVLIAIFGYLITPDQTPFANEQILELSCRKPGSAVKMLFLNKPGEQASVWWPTRMLWGEKNDYRAVPILSYYFKDEFIVVKASTGRGLTDGPELKYSLTDVLYGIPKADEVLQNNSLTMKFHDAEGRLISKQVTELRQDVEQQNLVVRRYWLGTDRYGRDMLSQLMIGTRVSLSVGLISVAISLLIGLFLGSVAGFFGGRTDAFITWIINVVWSIPTLLLVIAITFALGKGFWQVFIAVGLTMWVEVARVVRGQILSIREKEYVEAGKALGFRNPRIIFRHILPNTLAPVIVISAANFASAILIEAGLSFLGIGVQPPMPSWGTMIKDNYGYIILDSAYLAILPGLAIMIMVLAFMLIGNGLRDALDVKAT